MTSLRTSVSFLVLSRDGEELFIKLLCQYPDLDNRRGRTNHGCTHYCVKKSSQLEQ